MTGTEWDVMLLSLRVALASTILIFPLALALAWLLARRDFPGKILVDTLVHLPLVLPPVVIGWLLLLGFGAGGPAGRFLNAAFGIRLVFDWKGAALAAGVMALPLMVRAMRLALEGVDPRLEQAAATMGEGRLAVARRVVIPLALPGLVAGALLGFARALGEFGATIAFAANVAGETRTLSLAIFSAMQQPEGDAMVVRLAVLSIVISFVALLGAEWLARRAKRRN